MKLGPLFCHRGIATAFQSNGLRFYLPQGGIFNNKNKSLRLLENGGAELQPLDSVPNKPALNPKSLRSAYDTKAYVNARRSKDGPKRQNYEGSALTPTQNVNVNVKIRESY